MEEVRVGASFLVLWREGGELRKLLVDDTKGRSELVAVDVRGEEAADVSYVRYEYAAIWR